MRLLPLWVALCSTAALAQGFELDLSEPEIPAEFRPTIAVIGVVSGEAADDAVTSSRAKQLEVELVKAATSNAAFGNVMNPTQAAEALGAAAADARKCTDYACLNDLAKKLKVDRLIRGSVTKSGPASLLTLQGFDPGLAEVVGGTVESNERAEKAQIGGFAGIQGKSQAQKDKEFVKKANPLFFEVMEKIKTSNGKIVIDTAETSAITLLNGNELGMGSFEKVVARGSYDVKVAAVGYNTYETKVVVEPQKASTINVVLVAKEIAVKPVIVEEVRKATPLVERPGLYIAVAGAIAVGVGIALGVSAKGVEARAKPNADGVVPISRSAAQGAKTNALLANILVPAGSVLVAGGGLWVILTPGAGKKKEEAPPAETPATQGGGFGVMAGYSGSF